MGVRPIPLRRESGWATSSAIAGPSPPDVAHRSDQGFVLGAERGPQGTHRIIDFLRPRGASVVITVGRPSGRREDGADMTTPGPEAAMQSTDQIWREILPQLRTFVRRRISDNTRADDLVAEILLRVHQNIGSLDDRERLPNWVFRVARNAIIDEYRRAARSREQLTGTPGEDSGVAYPDEDQSEVLQELAACLRPLLEALPAEQRAAVQMIEFDGLSQADAAQLAGVSLSGMKSRVQRGRRRLAEALGQCCALTLDGRGMPMDYDRPPGCGCTK